MREKEDNYMEERLQFVLKEYIKEVEEICSILLRGINSVEAQKINNKYDFFEYRSNCKKMEFEVGGYSYRLHGKGCTAYNKEKFIDWDFGYRSRWCGIDPWKVAITLKKNNSPYTDFYDGNLIKTICERFVENGIMFKQYGQYYFEIPANETFIPEFPTEYDTLIIEYNDLRWSIQRNKIIERFIRKSSKIYNQIYEVTDRYMLRFLFNDKEVYTIPYNDVCYPENAVKIMNDEIIINFLKS